MGFFRRRGKRIGFLRCRVFRLGPFLLDRLLHQFIHKPVILALFRGGLLRGCRFLATLFTGFLDVLLDGRRIHHREFEFLHDPVGSGGVILEHQNVDGVVAFLHRNGRVEDSVALGLSGELRAILFFDGVDLHGALLPQHGFNAGFALGLFLIFQNRVKGGGKIFGGGAGDLEGKFSALQAHPHHLFRRVA